jgi:nitroreductase
MKVSDAIRLKRAVRKFSPEPLPDNIVQVILNAGRRAQSSKNAQPWNFIAITNKAILKDLSECGEETGPGSTNTWHLAGAALGVALIHPDPQERFQILFDIGQSAAYMQLAAWEVGVGSCLATIYNAVRARQVLKFPEQMTIRFAISFGYPLDNSQLSSPPRKGGRLTLEEIVHWNTW